MDKTAHIRELNDALRRTFAGGRVMLTAGVDALLNAEKAAVLAKVRTFDAFNGDNDPHGEHDFVSFDHEGAKYFAKMDYYDPGMCHASEEPDDASKTVRVLTVMRTDEYCPPATGVSFFENYCAPQPITNEPVTFPISAFSRARSLNVTQASARRGP